MIPLSTCTSCIHKRADSDYMFDRCELAHVRRRRSLAGGVGLPISSEMQGMGGQERLPNVDKADPVQAAARGLHGMKWAIASVRAVLIFGTILVAMEAWGAESPGDYMLKVTTQWVTPHVPWAKPYALGKPKVLFFCPKMASPREVVELNERLPMDFDVVTTYGSLALGADPNGSAPADGYTPFIQEMRPAQKEKEAISKLNEDWDAVVLGQFRLNALPEAAQKMLLTKVRSGMGLVLAFDGGFPAEWEKELEAVGGEERLHFAGLPLREIPGLGKQFDFDRQFGPRAEKLVRLYRLGKGRVVVLDYGTFSQLEGSSNYSVGHYSLTPWLRRENDEPTRYAKIRSVDDTTQTLYEYSLMLVTRALLWSVPEKCPRVTLAVEPGNMIFRQNELPKSIAFAITSTRSLDVEARSAYRTPWGEVLATGKTLQSVGSGAMKVDVSVPILPAGKHFLEMQLVSAAGVESWWAVPITVEAEVRVEKIVLNKEICSPGDEVAVEVKVSKLAPGVEARLEVIDVHDRVILRRALRKSAGELLTERFSLPPTAGTMVRLEVSLYSPNTTLLSSERKELRVFQVSSRRADFPFIIWNQSLGGYLQLLTYRQLRSLGFDAELELTSEARLGDNAYGDMAMVHYGVSGYHDQVADFARNCANEASNIKAFNILAYNFGDEIDMTRYRGLGAGRGLDAGTSEQEHQRFRSFLQEKYGAIENLNRAWGKRYGGFNEIPAITLNEARTTGDYPPIIERWLFMQRSWADSFGQATRSIREVDPKSTVGFEGAGSDRPEVWADHRLLGQVLQMWAPYSGCECSIVSDCLFQSFVPRDILSGNWWGGYISMRHEPLRRFHLWSQLIHGHNSLWVYRLDGIDGILGADLTPALHYRLLERDLKQIKGGIGQLVANSKWRPDPIAVYWSKPSILTRAVAKKQDGSASLAVHGLFHAIDNAGFVPRFVDKEDLGSLSPAETRVLVLVDTQCVSEEEKVALETYVREGGTLIADVPPGSCTELGLAREKPLLDELFGIRRSKDAPKGLVDLAPVSVKIEAHFLGKPLRLFQSDTMEPVNSTIVPGISAIGGTEVLSKTNGVPIFLTRAVEKGRVILLNFTFDNYLSPVKDYWTPLGEDCGVKRTIVWKKRLSFWSDLFSALGVEPGVKVIEKDGAPIEGVRRGLFSNDTEGIVVLACLSNLPDGEAILVLPRRSHVADLREEKYLGFLDRVPLSVGAGKGFAFSILPSESQGIQLKVPEKVKAGTTFSIAANVYDTDRAASVFRFVITGPDGKPCPWFSRRVITRSAEGAVAVVAAWNDAKGIYHVEAIDVASASRATGTFEITPGD